MPYLGLIAILPMHVPPATSPASDAAANESRFHATFFSPRGELRAAIIAGILLTLGYILHAWLKVPYTETFV